MKKKLNKQIDKIKAKLPSEEGITTDLSEVPRITNETVAEHREEVLKGARKYIYPLQHSKHKIVLITTGIVIIFVLAFLSYCILGLYKFKQDNAFLYRVTQVIPFPIARAGSGFVAYENYLFEIRHFKHYYQNQLGQNYENPKDKEQLEEFKKQALQLVVDNAYVKKLAEENGVSVSDKEVKERIEVVKQQNRLGDNDRVFEDVLKDYWGWSIRDFERSLRDEILAEKVVAKLDADANKKAEDTLAKLRAGANFGELAKQVSEDPTAKNSGGEYSGPIDKTNRDFPPQIIEALFSMQPGQVSEVINTGRFLEIVRLNSRDKERVTASHIVFRLKDPAEFVNNLKENQPARTYVTF